MTERVERWRWCVCIACAGTEQEEAEESEDAGQTTSLVQGEYAISLLMSLAEALCTNSHELRGWCKCMSRAFLTSSDMKSARKPLHTQILTQPLKRLVPAEKQGNNNDRFFVFSHHLFWSHYLKHNRLRVNTFLLVHSIAMCCHHLMLICIRFSFSPCQTRAHWSQTLAPPLRSWTVWWWSKWATLCLSGDVEQWWESTQERAPVTLCMMSSLMRSLWVELLWGLCVG